MTALGEGSDAGVTGGTGSLGEDRIKHLEFIQANITRMGTNSFLVKGWALTLAAGLLALSADRLSWEIASAGVVPLFCFWYLDCFFLRQERAFRRLYDDARRPDSTVEVLSMNVGPYLAQMRWPDVWLTPTLALFYAPLLIADLAVVLIAV